MFVPHRAETGSAEQEVSARPRVEPKPARGEHSEKVPARKKQHVPLDSPHPAYHPVGPRSDLVRRLPVGTAVTEQLPIRALGADVGAATTLVRAVVPFQEVGLDFRRGAEASPLTRSDRPLQGAREHGGERQSLEPLSQPDGLGFAPRGQR